MARIAENTVIVDGQEYKPGDVIPDFKSIRCVDTREPRKYQGLSADVSVLNDVIAKYASGGASCFMSDTGEYYEYDREEKTWKLITNITERGFGSEKAYGALKHMLKNVTVSDEKIQSAVTNYLTVNPVLPGATTEQAWQIEQNKTDVAALKEETGSLKEDLNEKSKTVVAKGFNMIEVCETGIGAYYVSGGDIKFNPSYTNYAYIIANVKKNTRYIYKTISSPARWAILTDEKNGIIKSFNGTKNKYFDTENATKLYITIPKNDFDNGIILSEGTNGQSDMIKVPVGCEDSFYRQTKETYACALPVKELHFTKGWDEKFYFDSILTPYKNNIFNGRYKAEDSDGIIFDSNSNSNQYKYEIYDEQLNRIDNNCICQIVSEPINLSDKTALVIGDSTVDFDTMTSKMLELFTENGAELTLLGTLGDGTTTNKNEGRAGWTTIDYFTNKKYNDVVNPFYNQDTETFDFKYYMNQQGYTSVDFVIIQLGINDLYNATNNYESALKNVISNIKKMIDSVFVFNDSIKVIINLPTTPNSDKSKHSVSEPLYRNRVIKYNELAQIELTDYPESKVRTSYCHLILDSKKDISDNVHPNTEGFAKMAKEVVSQMNVWMNS